MAVNAAAVVRKLNAILGKDIDEIVARHPYLPYIGQDYTRATLVDWAKRRTDLLKDVRDGNYTDQQIQNFIVNLYQSLNAADKALADKLRNDEHVDITQASTFAAYEKLVAMVLYKFAVTS